MTRAERLAKQEADVLAEIEDGNQRLALIRTKKRDLARKDLERRRAAVGLLAEQAGLFAWEDPTLAELFQLLATLKEHADPVAVLESLLADMPTPAHAVHGALLEKTHHA